MSSLPHVPIQPGDKSKRGPGPYRLDSFSTCPQWEGYAYELRLAPTVQKDALPIGTLVHAALAYHYAFQLPIRPTWLVYKDPYDAVAQLGHNSGRGDLIETAQRIYAWYAYTYQVDPWVPVLVEHQFQWNFGTAENPRFATCRTDLIAREGNDLILVDHKCKGRLGKNTGRSLSMDRQMLTNLCFARAAGYDIKRVVINGMTRDFPTPLFGRYDVPVSAEAYAHFAQDTMYFLDQREAVRKAYPDPMNRPRNTKACMSGPFGACEYLKLCEDGPARLVEYTKRAYE